MKFLENILSELQAVRARRQPARRRGRLLAGPAAGGITIADIIRAVEGPLANVQGVRPEDARVLRECRTAPTHVGVRPGEPARRARGT